MHTMIHKIAFENLKGSTRSIKLEPLTIITGRNHAGKSAVLDALTLGILGHIPALGKTPGATYKLASDRRMAVELTTADGRTISRAWIPKGSGVTSKTEGPEDILPSALAILEPRAFIGANAKTRLAMLAHLAGGKALDALAAKCQEWAKLLNSPYPHGGEPLTVAAEFRSLAAAKEKAAKDAIKMHTGAIQGLAPHESAPVKVTAAEMRAATDAVARAAAALTTARQISANLERAGEAADEAAAALQSLEGLTHDSGRHESLKIDAAAVAESIRKENEAAHAVRLAISQKSGELKTLETLVDGRAVQDIGAAIDGAEGLTTTQSELDAVIEALRQLDEHREGINEAIACARSAEKEAQEKITNLNVSECCPVCQASAEGWKATALAYYSDLRTTWGEQHAKGLAEYEALIANKTRLEAEGKRMSEELLLINELPKNKAIMDAAVKIPRLKMNIRNLQADEVETASRLKALAAEAEDIKAVILQCEKSASAIAKACELQAIIANAPKEADITAAMSAAMDAENTLEQRREESEQLAERARVAEQANTITQRMAEAQEAIGRETEKQTQFSDLKDEIDGAMAEAIADTYRPILSRAKIFGDGVITREITVQDDELGYAGLQGFIPFEAMSGTEQTVVTAAIQAALSEASGGFLMLDELSRLDAKNKQRFVANIADAIAEGTLAQAVIVDHDAAAWKKGFYTVTVDE